MGPAGSRKGSAPSQKTYCYYGGAERKTPGNRGRRQDVSNQRFTPSETGRKEPRTGLPWRPHRLHSIRFHRPGSGGQPRLWVRVKRPVSTPDSGQSEVRGPPECVTSALASAQVEWSAASVGARLDDATSGEPSGNHGNMALNGAEVDDFSWEPPTEAETKVLQARRERQDRISRLMGDYLLRGYRMLGDTCADCGTILLQDKQRKIYCVACQELDSDVDKDNPALNAQAALSQAREHQLASGTELPSGTRSTPQPPVPRPEHCEGAAAGLKAAQAPPPPAAPPNVDVVACTQTALLQKLTWASAELGSSSSLETSIQLCGLIRACADALGSLKQLQH